jgi:hypothetical protein
MLIFIYPIIRMTYSWLIMFIGKTHNSASHALASGE